MKYPHTLFRTLVALVVLCTTAPTLRAADGDAIAFANGKPISRQQVMDLLIESHGLEAMQQLIMLELARQETERRGLTVKPSDVQAEFQRSLDKIAAASSDAPLDEAAKRQALNTLLTQKGLSMAEFTIGMERNAHLRKIVEADFKVGDDTLREEFARTHGEKVLVRHIQLAESRDLGDVLMQLNKGADFAEVARRLSQNPDTAAHGGELPLFTFDDSQIPAALREAAFSLKPGEVSPPIRTEKWYHILKLERRIPPESAKFEDVRPQVETSLRERVIPQEMGKLANDLYQKAKIRVIEGKLKDRYETMRKDAGSAGPQTP